MKRAMVLVSVLFLSAWQLVIAKAQDDETTALCVLVYVDWNTNAVKDFSEGLAKDVWVEVFDLFGKRVAGYTTDGFSEPMCIPIEPNKPYLTTITAPEQYIPTTRTDWEMTLLPGSTGALEFGVSLAGAPPIDPKTGADSEFGAQVTSLTPNEIEADANQSQLIAVSAFAGVVIGIISAGFAVGYTIGKRRRLTTPAGRSQSGSGADD
jgi:hypothetical protein